MIYINLNLMTKPFVLEDLVIITQNILIDFPDECNDKVKFSVTHDPAGAFDPKVKGLVLAAHTHCGQVRLPFYGALWVPTSAPKEATCGVYKDNQRTVFTTSGAGTTVFPVRVGTQSEWDMLRVNFQRK